MLFEFAMLMRPRLLNGWSNRSRLVAAVLLMPFFVYPFALGFIVTDFGVPSAFASRLSFFVAVVSFGLWSWLVSASMGPVFNGWDNRKRFVVALLLIPLF